MAINKAMLAALRALSYIDIDVCKTYKAERALDNLAARINVRPSSYEVWDNEVCSVDYCVPVRIFVPPVGGSRLLVFLHGGGWVTGNIDTYETVCVDMAKMTGQTVIAVDYRLAPEHPFPKGLEDCYAVVREVFHGHYLGTSFEDVTLIGDSAGGNLAAAVSLMARDRGEFLPHQQILIYPATFNDHSENSPFPSIVDNGTDYLLTSRRIREYMEMYMGSELDLTNPYFAPLLARSFDRQPRTLIITAEFDPLRDEGECYGEKLRAAGNTVEIHRMKDALHGFFSLPTRYAHVKRAYKLINDFLSEEQ